MAITAPAGLVRSVFSSLTHRRRVLLAGAVMVGLGCASHQVWRASNRTLRDKQRYALTPAMVHIDDRPPWVEEGLRDRVVARAAMQGSLSLLEPQTLSPRLAEAFRVEPWVQQVRRVEIAPPDRVRVQLEWRTPLAAVEVRSQQSVRLLLVDSAGVRLPTGSLSEALVRRLPRIKAVLSTPPEGEAWTDRQVLGAVRLITRLGGHWHSLSLADIAAGQRPEIRGERQFYRFDLWTIGGTQIVWGAAPDEIAPDEKSFEQKLHRLEQFLAESGAQLDSHRSPKLIDLRYGLDTERRIAKKDDEHRTANAEQGDEERDLLK